MCSENVDRRETALVAESDPELRQLIRGVLHDFGYDVVLTGNAEQLEVALRTRPLLDGSGPLAVLGIGLATYCASALTAASAQRARAGATEISLILIYERGTLATVAKPSLGPCSVGAIF
jgi:CheY-like chemotaxis protein